MSNVDHDAATELLIAQLLEQDLDIISQTKELEQAQIAQTLSDSALAAGKIPKKKAVVTEASDTEIALTMLAADARMSSDAAYAQALQHSDDAASIASRQYAQKLLATEKKVALDAEFARRLYQMDVDGEDIENHDAERILSNAEIEAILAANPNEKGKGKGKGKAQHTEQQWVKLEEPDIKMEAEELQSLEAVHPSCGICLEQFQLVHSPNHAARIHNASSSAKLPFGLNISCAGSHTYCQDCLQSYIQSKIDPEGDGSGNPNTVVFPIRCPECPITHWPGGISDDIAERVLSEKGMLIWHHQKLLDSLPRLYCPNARCSALVQAHDDPDEPQAECPACKSVMCVSCRVQWHDGLSCEDYQALPLDERAPEDQQALQLMRAQNWRRCPNCQVIVELTMGCNHITCRCGSHFCFKCGSKWDTEKVKCTRDPPCDLWDEDMLLEQRERDREARRRAPVMIFPPALPAPQLPQYDFAPMPAPPPYVPQIPAWNPRNNGNGNASDLMWMMDSDILCTRHWFTANMISDLTCGYCAVKLNSLADLRYHLSHTRRHEVFACCGRFFKREVDFDRHVEAYPRRLGSHVHQVRRG